MKINVAGAGAGKTTGLANEIIQKRMITCENKNIYCIAFTNNAAASIKGKLQEYYGIIPHNIIICTIHSFLYQEIISPYFYLLYKKHYKSISTIQLPDKPSYKAKRLSELENQALLHVEKIPERAKWVITKKSTDKTHEKTIRKIIISTFLSYCGAIYIDEAQDIDSHMKDIFSALDEAGAEIILNGDPKQDLRGYSCFRQLIETHQADVVYNPICYRCPIEHLVITNSFISKEEYQTTPKKGGLIELIFEQECCLSDLFAQEFDLKYIYKKTIDLIRTKRKTNTTVLTIYTMRSTLSFLIPPYFPTPLK